MRARWQVVVERICCWCVDLNQWGGLYDMLDTRFNRHVGGTHHPQGPPSLLILDTDSWFVTTTKSALVLTLDSVNNITWSRMWWRGRVILTAAFLLVRNYSACPQSGHWSGRDLWHGRGLGMSSTDSLTSEIEMQEEYCIRIKWKTILTLDRRSSCQGK